MAKTLVDNVSETFTPPRRRWMPWRRKTVTEQVGERVGEVTEQVGQTASDLASSVSEKLAPSSSPRWLPWRRKTLGERVAERVGDVTGQVSGTTSDVAGQVMQKASGVAGQIGQASSDLLEQARARTAGLMQPAGSQSMPSIGSWSSRAAFQAGKLVGRLPGRATLADSLTGPLPGETLAGLPAAAGPWSGTTKTAADLSAERAAFAAEAAAQAAQRAVGLMERVGAWVGLLASRPPQQEPVLRLAPATPIAERAATAGGMVGLVAPVAEASLPEAGAGEGMTNRLKQVAMNVGERINDWSDGRYGLEPQKLDKGSSAQKKSDKQRARLAEKAAKEAAKSSGVSWLPWVIGLSIGLVIGLVGVAYWQRQRLQHLWGETSQRVQQATGNMRQRLETSRSPLPQTLQQDIPPTTPNLRSLGSATPVTDVDQPTNGRLESTSQ